MTTAINFQVNTGIPMDTSLETKSLAELQAIYHGRLERGRKQFNSLCLIAGELGWNVDYVGGWKVREYAFTGSQGEKIVIGLSRTKGAYLPAEKRYSETRSISVQVNGKQYVYLRETNDPHRETVTEFYTPGAWEEELSHLEDLAGRRHQMRQARAEENERQKLLKLLIPGYEPGEMDECTCKPDAVEACSACKKLLDSIYPDDDSIPY